MTSNVPKRSTTAATTRTSAVLDSGENHDDKGFFEHNNYNVTHSCDAPEHTAILYYNH